MRNHSRYQRVKTDYQKAEVNNSSFAVELRSNTPYLSSVHSQNDNNILSRILNEINHQKKYDTISTEDIQEQHSMLRKKLKEMNSKLAKLIEQQWHKRNEQERINNKAIMGRQMGVNYNQLCREYIQNTNKIKSMEEEFKENNQKLVFLSSPDSKLSLSKKIADIELKIKEIKQSLVKIKKNKIMREREIIKVSENDRGQLNSLQLDYINIAKKSQYLVSRTQKIQEELADSEYSLSKQKDYYDQLRDQCQQIDKSETNPANVQHMKILYDSHKKKLDLHQKRNQRDEQTKKRKYYSLLVEYQKEKKKDEVIDCRIEEREEEIERSMHQIRKLLDELERLKYQKQLRNQSLLDFMITEIPSTRVALQLKNQDQRNLQKKPLQNGTPKRYSMDRNVRKWNSRVQGSIVKQKTKSHHNVTQITELQNENESSFSIGKSNFKKSLQAGQIRHFHTESTPVMQYQQEVSMTESQIGEIYPQDFQG